MGFTAGFLGGLTLTSSVLYLTTLAHQRARLQQALSLRESARALRSVYDPEPAYVPPSLRARHAGIAEQAKDRWNADVERVVRKVQHTDWNEVREGVEEAVGNVWERLRKSGGN